MSIVKETERLLAIEKLSKLLPEKDKLTKQLDNINQEISEIKKEWDNG